MCLRSQPLRLGCFETRFYILSSFTCVTLLLNLPSFILERSTGNSVVISYFELFLFLSNMYVYFFIALHLLKVITWIFLRSLAVERVVFYFERKHRTQR